MTLKQFKEKNPFLDLFKCGILINALFTAGIGFYVSSITYTQSVDVDHFIKLILSLIPLFAGSAALNHYFEIDVDSKMERTRHRPLPSKKIKPSTALIMSVFLILIGLISLYLLMPFVCFISAVALVALYNFIYTPLKKVTWINTYIGAIPGAIPPLCGWLSVQAINKEALALFFIFYFWQLPHFFAIAWQYKESYLNGGLKMLSGEDESGSRTKFHILMNTLFLFLSTGIAFKFQLFGVIYLWGVIALSCFFFWFVILFLKNATQKKAKHVMLASIVYQPLLILIMALDIFF
jgi:heme o synthase